MTTYPMSADEARDLAFAKREAEAIQAAFNAIANRAQNRLGLKPGRYGYDLERCVWTCEEAEAPQPEPPKEG